MNQRKKKLFEQENPNNATAVMTVLNAVTHPVPKRRIIFADNKLDTMVPPDIVSVTKLAQETGRSKSLQIAGHAVPNKAWGTKG